MKMLKKNKLVSMSIAEGLQASINKELNEAISLLHDYDILTLNQAKGAYDKLPIKLLKQPTILKPFEE